VKSTNIPQAIGKKEANNINKTGQSRTRNKYCPPTATKTSETPDASRQGGITTRPGKKPEKRNRNWDKKEIKGTQLA